MEQDELTPEQWQQYLINARNILHDPASSPDLRHQAAAAIKQATEVLNQPNQQAIAAGENVGESGWGELGPALKGLGESAWDIPKGLFNTVAHPIQTLKSLPKLPAALLHGITSGDPEQIARTVGNVGSFALPFAKVSPRVRIPGIATSAATAAEIARAPSVAGLIGKALTNNPLAETLRMPGARNAASRAQAASATAASSRIADLAPEQLAQAKLRTQIMEQQLAKLKGGPETTPVDRTMDLDALVRQGGNPTPPPETPPSAPAPKAPFPPPSSPPEVLKTMTPEEIAQHPLSQTPPLEQSAARPVTEPTAPVDPLRDVLSQLRSDPGKIAPGNPLAPEQFPLTQELIENQAGKMGQKAVQFGQGSPLGPAAQAEILQLLGELSNILGKK